MAQIDTLTNVGAVVSTDLALILRGGANVLGTLGSMVGQNSTAVTITGGTINGTVIGGTTAAAGSFTTGAFSSTLGVTGAATFGANIGLNNAYYLTGKLVAGTPVALIGRAADDRVTIDPDGYGVSVIGAATFSGNVTVNGGNAVIGTGGGGNGLGALISKGAVANFYEAYDGTKTMIAGTDAGNDYVKIGSLSAHPVGFVVGNGERMRIDASGNVGIGTSLPAAKLHLYTAGLADGILVEGNDNNNVKLRLKNIGAGGEEWQTQVGQQGASNNGFHIRSNTSGVNALSLYSTGAATFNGSVTVPSGATGKIVGADNTSYWLLQAAAAGGASIYLNGGTRVGFESHMQMGAGKYVWRNIAHTVDHMTLDAGGNLTIGASGVGGTKVLSIIGGEAGSSAQINLNSLGYSTYIYQYQNNLVFGKAAAEYGRFDAGGNFLVGHTAQVLSSKVLAQFSGATHNGIILNETADTASTTFAAFSLSGTAIGSVSRVGATSAVAYNTTSDERLKSNIANSDPVLEKIMQVQVRQYDWTEGNLHQDYGFIAQELAPVLSGIVTEGKEEADMWQLDYSRLTPALLKAIQEQQAIIESLTARIEALEGAK